MSRRGRSTSSPSSTLCTRRHFRGDVLPQAGIVPQILRLDAADDPLGLADQLIQLLAAADVELAEPLEELGQVLNGTISENLGLAILLARKPLRQVRDQLGQFGGKRLLGQTHGFVETGLHPLALLFVELRVELLQIVWGFHRGKIELHGKHAAQRFRVVPGVEQRSEPLPGRGLQFAVVAVQGLRRLRPVLPGTPASWRRTRRCDPGG